MLPQGASQLRKSKLVLGAIFYYPIFNLADTLRGRGRGLLGWPARAHLGLPAEYFAISIRITTDKLQLFCASGSAGGLIKIPCVKTYCGNILGSLFHD